MSVTVPELAPTTSGYSVDNLSVIVRSNKLCHLVLNRHVHFVVFMSEVGYNTLFPRLFDLDG